MKKHMGGLARFLNNETQKTTQNQAEGIVYIDIDNIVANPRNFYGLRDIESLAGLIAVSHMVEPLTVCPEQDGKYMLISGHRRRAAVQKLLDEGDYDERRLPCIIRPPRKITIPQENGEDIVFDESAVELLNLIASNRGQRKERTMDERLREVKYLEPFARAIFAQKRQEQGKGMVFRKFFAEEILDISSSKLQRIEAIGKMSNKVKAAVENGLLKETNAVRLTGLSQEEQDAALDWLEQNKRKGTMQDIEEAIKTIRGQDEDEESYLLEESLASKDGEQGDLSKENNEEQIDDLNGEKTVAENVASNISSELKTTATSTHTVQANASARKTTQLMDIPDSFENPQEEAEDWFLQERLSFYQSVYEEAKRLSESEANERKAAQWDIRASVARYHIAELTEKAKESKYKMTTGAF